MELSLDRYRRYIRSRHSRPDYYNLGYLNWLPAELKQELMYFYHHSYSTNDEIIFEKGYPGGVYHLAIITRDEHSCEVDEPMEVISVEIDIDEMFDLTDLLDEVADNTTHIVHTQLADNLHLFYRRDVLTFIEGRDVDGKNVIIRPRLLGILEFLNSQRR